MGLSDRWRQCYADRVIVNTMSANNIDYRELLVKYMAYVIAADGKSYIAPWARPDWISAEEWAVLMEIDRLMVDA